MSNPSSNSWLTSSNSSGVGTKLCRSPQPGPGVYLKNNIYMQNFMPEVFILERKIKAAKKKQMIKIIIFCVLPGFAYRALNPPLYLFFFKKGMGYFFLFLMLSFG